MSVGEVITYSFSGTHLFNQDICTYSLVALLFSSLVLRIKKEKKEDPALHGET